MSGTPNILMTGMKGVGKSTILNLFPSEIILELDDNFNEVFQKLISFSESSNIKECILREIDLQELSDNYHSFHNLLQTIDIALLVVDSTKRNVEESRELLNKLRENIVKVEIYVIANFQDRKSISWSPEIIEEFMNLRTFEFSAIQDDSEEKIYDIIIEIIEKVFPNIDESKDSTSKIDYSFIWPEIEVAKLLEGNQDYNKAALRFSDISKKLKKNSDENDDIKVIYFLCKAYEHLQLGIENKEVKNFSEAEILFNQANEYLIDTNLKNLVYPNSIFCEILKLSTQYDELNELTKKTKTLAKIQDLIRSAINFYKEGGFIKEAEWAKDTLKAIEEK